MRKFRISCDRKEFFHIERIAIRNQRPWPWITPFARFDLQGWKFSICMD